MRRLLLISCSVLLLASLSLAKDKVESHWNCAKPSDAHSIDVGDQPNHTYTVTKTICAGSKAQMGGVNQKEGIGTQFDETMGDTTTWHGMFVVTADNGDKIYYAYLPPHGIVRAVTSPPSSGHGRRASEGYEFVARTKPVLSEVEGTPAPTSPAGSNCRDGRSSIPAAWPCFPAVE